MSYWVYVHVCPNGKRYVGCTTRVKPEIRWGRNGEGYKGQLFGKAVRKYGWSSITHEVFEVDSAEEMYRKEVELISFYHSNDPKFGYNCSTGGEHSFLGCRHSEEVRKRISETLKGKTVSEEARKHMAEAQKKKWSNSEYREKMSRTRKGTTLSDEHKRHIAETAKERWTDPEFRKRMSEIQKNRPKIKIKLPDGTIIEMSKQNLARNYVNKGKKFEYVD